MKRIEAVIVLIVLQFFLFVNTRLWAGNSVDHFLIDDSEALQSVNPCPCDDPILCLPLEESVSRNGSAPHAMEYKRKSLKKAVFAFVLRCDMSVWSKFDWAKLTTIGIAGFYDAGLVCHAHRHGVRVVKLGSIPTSDLPHPSARLNWIKLQASDVALKFIDGINIDFEDAIEDGSPEQEGLTNLVRETVDIFHADMPGSQVSFDVAWAARGIDGRFYDYRSIANYSDLIFIMSYDEQSQIFDGPCSARPNSGIYKTAIGAQSYLNLGIPEEKIILGVPWYGYNYPCVSLLKNDTCLIKEVPFRGANCSDAAGKEFPYSYMMSIKEKYKAQYKWDKNSLTPYFNIKDESGQIRQMRYDDPRSLVYKYMLAIASRFKGVGMWTANFLDYSDSPEALEQQNAMWGLLP